MKKHNPRRNYHMLPQDIRIWDRFLLAFEKEYDRFDYDVRVGPLPPNLPDLPPNLQPLVDALYRLRIDVVAWKGDQPTIIEVKPNAGLSCLGQLLTYNYFWRKEKKSRKKPILMAVTDNARPYMPELFQEFGIRFTVV